MELTWKKMCLILVSLLIIAGASFWIWKSQTRGRITPSMVNRPRVCEACGKRSDGPTEPLVLECPFCHKKETVRVHSYVCRACGAGLDVFRERLADLTITKMDTMAPPDLVYKREGGTEWISDFRELGDFKCPKCGSTNVGPPRPK